MRAWEWISIGFFLIVCDYFKEFNFWVAGMLFVIFGIITYFMVTINERKKTTP